MSMFGLILAAAIAGTPAGADSSVTITTTKANQWVRSSVDVEAWNRPEISVEQDVLNGKPGDVHAEITRSGSSITVTAVYTGPQTSYFFGLMHAGSNESFHWIVHVPATRPLNVDVANGRVAVTGVTAPIAATSSNGRIRIDGAGPIVEARTANGEVDASIATLAGGPPRVTLRSSNGRITLRVPRAFTTRVDASTVNGRVENPLSDGSGPGSASARTSNGSIEITVGT